MEALMPIITQLIAGAAGGNAASAVLKQGAFSVVARTIVGAIGGLGGEAAATGLAMQALGGLVGGGVLSGIVGQFLGKQA